MVKTPKRKQSTKPTVKPTVKRTVATKAAAPARTTALSGTMATAKSPRGARRLFGFNPSAWVRSVSVDGASADKQKRNGFIFFFGRRDVPAIERVLKTHLPAWQLSLWLKSESDSLHGAGLKGPVWMFLPSNGRRQKSHEGRLEKSSFARARDQIGSAAAASLTYELDQLIIEFRGASIEDERGALVGLELGSYMFTEASGNKPMRSRPEIVMVGTQSDVSERLEAAATAEATNIARHLVNVPPDQLNPLSYSASLQAYFKGTSVDVEVWDPTRLAAERMNLMLAVGRGAEHGPRLAILRYRPADGVGHSRHRPIAFVGKGITFDSGGLDIKPSSGMRLMKKDMGGSAAVVGLMHWASAVKFERPIDAYLPLAENSLDGRSFRPSDVIESRQGMRVEIHNTDAEGRLVLADALDLAASQDGDAKPSAIIDVATLTGAIKVALGAEIAGLFSNDDGLAESLEGAGQAMGDLCWRMPLFSPYKAMLKSSFADMANASDGFGGAITAALFLEPFVHGVPWAHLDVYAWRESVGGAFAEIGGSGQPVQALIEATRRISAGTAAELG